MRVLIIDDRTKAMVQQLIELATAEPYSLEQITEMAKGFDPKDPSTRGKASYAKKFTIDIPRGFCVTYTHENQPMGLCRHLSVSVPSNLYPHPEAVKQIMALFGFKGPLEQCIVYEEKYAEGCSAINVVEKIAEG